MNTQVNRPQFYVTRTRCPISSACPRLTLTVNFTESAQRMSDTLQLVIALIAPQRIGNDSPNVRYALLACRDARWIELTSELAATAPHDKLKRIGHSLSHFVCVEW